MKKIIKNILKIFGWKLIKLNTKIPKSYSYKQPEIEEIKYIINSKGVLHLGGHRGTEAAVYDWLNKKVLWIEAIPEIFKELEINIKNHYNQKAICTLLGNIDKKDTNFNLSNRDQSCSSIFDLSEEVKTNELWKGQNIKMTDSINLQMRTLDSIFEEHKISSKEYNHWVIDLQGSELIFLEGSIKSLKDCDSITIEVSLKNFYQNGAKWMDIKNFLYSNDFKLYKNPDENIDNDQDIFFFRSK